MISPSKIKT